MAVVPVRFLRRARDLFTTPAAKAMALAEGARLGKGVRFIGLPVISLARDSEMRIGERSLLCSATRGNALGISHPVVLRTWLPGATLRVAPDVGISGATICASVRIEIGQGTLIGANALIVDNDFHPTNGPARRYADNPQPRPEDAVIIGANVFVGTGAMILKGSTIGDDAMIGAGAVVSGSVPAGAAVVGNPARVVKSNSP